MKQKSFTLIEILIVIVVVGVISTFIIVAINSMSRDSRDSKRVAEITNIRNAIWLASSMGAAGYPTTPEQGFGARATCCLGTGDTTNCSNIESVLGSTVPKDPLYTGTNKDWCYNYKSDGSTFDLYTKLEEGGIIFLSETKVTPTKDTDDCGIGWINTGLGFCVMQWEAKIQGDDNGDQWYDSSFVPESRESGTPMAYMTQAEAIAECRSIGAHLITNEEWMALARDIESVSSNYVSGVLKRGNVGDTNLGGYNGSDPEAGVTNSLGTLTLSNGQQIHHLGGNVREWVDYVVSGTGSRPQLPFHNFSDWAEIGGTYDVVTSWGNVIGYDDVGPKNKSLSSSEGIGLIYYGSSDTFATPLMRGGAWNFTGSAGIFMLRMDYGVDDVNGDVGFRCAR